jgi:hypothetical protein
MGIRAAVVLVPFAILYPYLVMVTWHFTKSCGVSLITLGLHTHYLVVSQSVTVILPFLPEVDRTNQNIMHAVIPSH